METDATSEPTDAELLLAAGDDAAAFTRLYRRHVRRVYAWFDQRIAWAAADLTAETFARATQSGYREAQARLYVRADG